MKRLNQSGYNLVELIIAVGILATLASTVMVARTFMAKQTVRTNDKAYATQKAIQMFEELKALVNGGEKQGVNVLDQYSDGSAFNNVLTTDKNVDVFPVANAKPDDPLSGNKNSNGH
ncbi:MAG TPA: prepilin-type N-terminal cleavage/methylation domain-containing protein, partial [bacterium]